MLRIKTTLLATFCALLFGVAAQAAVIVIDADGSGDAETLGDAITMAFANDEADEIILNPGVYFNEDSAGNVIPFIGEDDIVIRGADPENRPVIAVLPYFNPDNPDDLDGIFIQMAGNLTFENVIITPSDLFTVEAGVDDLIAVFDHGTPENPSSLELTFRNVLIAHSDANHVPATTDGWDDPRGTFNTIRDDAINIDASGGDEIHLVLDGVIITAFGDDATSDAVVLDGPNVRCTITGGSRFTFFNRNGIHAFNSAELNILGTAEEPIIVYGGNSLPFRTRGGTNVVEHLWVIGIRDHGLDFNTGFGGRLDAVRAGSLTLRNCIFANTVFDGLFLNFDDGEPFEVNVIESTFYNVPTLLRIGYDGTPRPPSEIISFNIVDTIFDAADAEAQGTEFFSPDLAVVDYGAGDLIESPVSITNLAYNAETLASSRSESRTPTLEGNIIADADFGFLSTVFDPNDFSDYLVVGNCDLLAGQASDGAPLQGARASDCDVSVSNWPLY